MKEPATQDEVEERRLENEYRELCNDWWQRDKYILDKLSGASILFGLLGLAVSNVPPERPLIKLILLFAGAFFSMILCISMAKDMLYRDGTEALLIRLAARLRITDSLKDLEHRKDLDDKDFSDGLEFRELQFPRKVKIRSDKSSLMVLPGWWVRHWIEKQPTFRWLLSFYAISFVVFLVLFILILVNWIFCLNLPI